ncbi:MAG: hypothetical protein ACI8ZM_005404 [Crocinitomix sp.]|jgi:hypothetical protein
MRMQLGSLITCLFVSFAFASSAQGTKDSAKVQLENIEVSFLGSYYEQDGNHSAVTGGVGTEYLTNIAPSVVIKFPIDTVHTINVDGGVDFYSSASSDNINNPFGDPNHVSGASAKDERVYVNLGIKKKNNQKHNSKGLSLGVSDEFDVFSMSVGGSLSKSSKDENNELSVKLKYYFDSWKLIYPIEFRNGDIAHLPTNQRHSINFSATGSSIINKKMTASLTSDVVVQSGLLSTPFHRVYFQGATDAAIEKLPGLRVKFPVGLRFNYYMNDVIRLRTFFRYYADTWGVQGQTVKVELPLKLHQAFRVIPFYRFHRQTAANYFGEYKALLGTEEFFTSDFDLSGLSSHKVGLGVSISPLFGLARVRGVFRKNSITMLKSIDLRYANYSRSDGFKANIFTFGVNFTVQNRKM